MPFPYTQRCLPQSSDHIVSWMTRERNTQFQTKLQRNRRRHDEDVQDDCNVEEIECTMDMALRRIKSSEEYDIVPDQIESMCPDCTFRYVNYDLDQA